MSATTEMESKSHRNVLFVDDEVRILRSLRALFSFEPKLDVYTANSAKEALALMKEKQFHVVVSDQRMPEMTGVELLDKIREISPSTMRILLTGYADLNAIMGSINEGEVFRYITKPWKSRDLHDTVMKATEIASQFLIQSNHLSLASDQSNQEDSSTSISPVESPTDTERLTAELGINEQEGILCINTEDNNTIITEFTSENFKNHDIFSAHTMNDVIDTLKNKKIAVVIAAVAGNGEDTLTLLKLLKSEHPMINTIAVANQVDAEQAISLINYGQIYRYLKAPISQVRLKISVQSALDYYARTKHNPAIMARHIVESVKVEHAESAWLARFLDAMKKLTHRQGIPRIR